MRRCTDCKRDSDSYMTQSDGENGKEPAAAKRRKNAEQISTSSDQQMNDKMMKREDNSPGAYVALITHKIYHLSRGIAITVITRRDRN